MPATLPSGTTSGYRVTLESNDLPCTCPDFELRAKPCKHIFAAAIFVKRQTVTETTTPKGETVKTTVTETTAVRVTYKQDWRAYKAAQTAEKELFCYLWRDLCSTVPQPEQRRGRPRVPIADALFVAGYTVYSGMSGRCFATDVREAHMAGLIAQPYHFNTVLGVIEEEAISPVLHQLIAASAAPLRSVESSFAVDSTGFGVTQYYRHFTAKWGGAEVASHDWLKLHALVGTSTNVIAPPSVTDRNAHDSPEFAPLVLKGAESFDIHDVAACTTCTVTTSWLATMFAATPSPTFSAMKRVFGDTLRSKGHTAQENELLLKEIGFNITCLIHSIFELGVEVPGLSACTQKATTAHKKAG